MAVVPWQKHHDTAVGYTKESMGSKDVENLESGILHLICAYYYLQVKWNTKQHSDRLTFADENSTVICSKVRPLGSQDAATCLIDTVISREEFKQFGITFKLDMGDSDRDINFFMGYASSIGDIANFNHALGNKDNQESSVSLYVHYLYTHLSLCGKYRSDAYVDEDEFDLDLDPFNPADLSKITNSKSPYDAFQKLPYESVTPFDYNDVFTMRFIFEQDCCEIYHNETKTAQLALHGEKAVIPGVSIICQHHRVRILRYEYEYKQQL